MARAGLLIPSTNNPIIPFCKNIYVDIGDKQSLEENVVFFKSPSEIKTLSEMQNKKIRIGGMVKTDSISIVNKELNFIITDFKNEINVVYSGLTPNLFEDL